MPVELPEIVISSKTQSKEVIDALLKEQGYEVTDYTLGETTDAPAPEAAPVEDKPAEPVVEAPPAEEIPAGEVAGEEEEEVEAAAPAEVPATPAPAGERKNVPGSVKNKLKLQAKEQEILDLKARLEALEKRPAPSAAAPAPAAEVKPPEPEPELRAKPVWADFESADDQLAAYTEAVGEWVVDNREFQKDKERREKERTEAPVREAAERTAAENKQVLDSWVERTTPVKEKYPDFDRKISEIPPTPVMASVVMREDDGPELAYWLADNPDELLALNAATKTDAGSTPAQVQVAMGKMHQALGRIRYIMSQDGQPAGEPSREAPPTPPVQAPPVPQKPPAAAAPPAKPVVPVKPAPVTAVGSRGGSSNKTLANMTDGELKALHPDEYRRRIEKGERPGPQ